MTCEQHCFRPYPGPKARLYCEWCGVTKDVGSSTASAPARRTRNPRSSAPTLFDAPYTAGAEAEAQLARALREVARNDEDLAGLDRDVEDVLERRVPVDDPDDDRLGVGTGL